MNQGKSFVIDVAIPGLQGPRGVQGDKGDQGIQGIQGPQGIQGIQGSRGPAGTFYVDRFVLTADDIAAQLVTLTYQPADDTQLSVTAHGGPNQRMNVDYVLVGQVFSWAGMGLATILVPGDELEIIYYK